MILNSAKSAVQTSDTLDHKQASISLNPVILHILSRDLYQNHIESPFREILINAVDAHTEAGVTRPVDIHLPTMWDETFFIRDYGSGLSHERFMEIYLDYGNSDRRDSNEVHGGLGLGTKSPLAYTNSFTVTSWHGGHERMYMVYYNEDNIPCVDLVSDTDSKDVNTGLKVQFTATNPQDWSQFHKAAKEVLCRLPATSYNIVNMAAVSFGPEDLVLPESHAIGTIRLFKGKGKLSVVMGYVNYKLDPKTVLDYLNTRNISISIQGRELSVSSLIHKLLAANNVEIMANIGDYPVHPSREYINVTPRAITRLCTELEGFLGELFSNNDLSLEEDAHRYNLAGILTNDKSQLRIRARYIVPDRYYSYYRRISLPGQLSTYGGLVQQHAEWGGPVKVALIEGTELTDYVGNNRRHFFMPANFPDNTALVLVDKGIMTDPDVLEELEKFEQVDVKADIAAYLAEKEREASELSPPSHRPRQFFQRTVVRSMQDTSHNILVLKNSAFDNHSPGARKLDWASGAYNVASLKDMNKEIFWLPTKIGCARGDNVDALRRYNQIRSIVPTWKAPVFIGLPASKGTLSFERAFKPISELDAWIEAFVTSDYVMRRFRLSVLHDSLPRINTSRLQEVQAYGSADWLSRLVRLNRFTKNISYIGNYGYTGFGKLRDDVKASSSMLKLSAILHDLSIKFPLIFVVWGYGLSDFVENNNISDALPLWAEHVALITNNHPTGMRNK